MKNSIIDVYLFWLNKFYNAQKSIRLKGYAKELMSELPDVKSIGHLRVILSSYHKSQKKPDPNNVVESGTFFGQIETWDYDLIQLEEKLRVAKKNIEKIASQSKKIISLLTVIKTVLNAPQTLLHCSALCLLTSLEEKNIQPSFIEYLATLPVLPPPKYIPPGSFAAKKPSDLDHASSLALLNDVCQSKGHDVEKELANSLLQSLLYIHNDLFESNVMQEQEQKLEHCSL